MRGHGRRRFVVSAGLLSVTLAAAGVVVATGGAAHADQVVPVACSMPTGMAGTLTNNVNLTLGVNAPAATPPGSTIAVSVSGSSELLPASDGNPQNLVAYEHLQTTYVVTGASVVANSERASSGATIKTFPVPSRFGDASNSVTTIVDGPIPPGTFVAPGFTFLIHVNPAATSVKVVATEHDETVDFDGPGPAESNPATCPIGVTLATTTVDPDATTTISSSTSTSSTSSSSSTSTSTSSSSSTSTSTTTTIDPPPPGQWSMSNPVVTEPTQGHGAQMFFVITRSDSSAPARVKFMTADGTAVHRLDFTQRAGTVKLRARQSTMKIDIPIHYNRHFRGQATFIVLLIDPATGQYVGCGTGTINPG